MSVSRLSGENFEFLFAHFCVQKRLLFFNRFTENKYLSLKKLHKNDNNLFPCFERVLKHMKADKCVKFEWISDMKGREGRSEDFVLYDGEKSISISCKKNNTSIKHQRPSNMYAHMGLSNEEKNNYISKYKQLNDDWFKKTEKYQTFSFIPAQDKLQLYSEINSVVLEFLLKAKSTTFYEFLFASNPPFVLKNDTRKKILSVYSCVSSSPTLVNGTMKSNALYLTYSNDIVLKLRIHNASKNITKSLSLKYDTTIANFEKLYSETQFKYSDDNEMNRNGALRYPGGKTRTIKFLERYVSSPDAIYSPFFGGGLFELFLLNKYQVPMFANDKFEPLYNFWECVKNDKNHVLSEIQKIHPITKEIFLELKKKLIDTTHDSFARASWYFAINRSLFSGATLSGGFSQESAEKRFNTSSIERINRLSLSDVVFSKLDFSDFIKSIPDGKFIFLDPAPVKIQKCIF